LSPPLVMGNLVSILIKNKNKLFPLFCPQRLCFMLKYRYINKIVRD
jgi:hypothetical protein